MGEYILNNFCETFRHLHILSKIVSVQINRCVARCLTSTLHMEALTSIYKRYIHLRPPACLRSLPFSVGMPYFPFRITHVVMKARPFTNFVKNITFRHKLVPYGTGIVGSAITQQTCFQNILVARKVTRCTFSMACYSSENTRTTF